MKDTHLKVTDWMFRLLICNIPVIGFCYLIAELTSSVPERKRFAAGFLLYKLIMLATAAVLLFVIVRLSIPYWEQLLDYMETLK